MILLLEGGSMDLPWVFNTLKSSLFVFLVQVVLITGFKACIFATAYIKLLFLKLADRYIYVCVHIYIIHIHNYCIYNIQY